MKEIILKPIGTILTPYKQLKNIPIQGKFKEGVKGKIHLLSKYKMALKGLEGFSHLILIYYFNRSNEEKIIGKPFLENEEYGIFAIRSPHRPNHIGMSIVKVEKIEGRFITFSEVDMLDGTPLLDIKPYVSHFDTRNNVKNGWIEKHFKKNNNSQTERIR